MDVWLIANVGQRDLYLDGGPLDKGRLRSEGARLLEEYESVSRGISAPMLSAALDYIGRSGGGVRARVLLTATDQEDVWFREGDTVTCAKVLERHLALSHRRVVVKVVVRTTRDQPNLYDRMLEYYQGRGLDRLEPAGERYYLLLAGGTPAANTALLLAGIWRFGAKVCALSVSEQAGVVRPMDVGRRIVDSYRRDRVAELVDRRDFAGAAGLLEAGSAARYLADAAAKRLNLDFAPSRDILAGLLEERGGNVPAPVDALHVEAQQLAQGDSGAVVREVYWNAMVKWRREEYADFLGRVWRLAEAAVQEAVGRVCGFSLADKWDSHKPLNAWAREQPGLWQYIEQEAKEPKTVIEQNAWLLGVILEWIVAHHPDGQSDVFRKCRDAVRSLDSLRNLRNKCVLAHGFKGLSKEELLRTCGCGDQAGETRLMDDLGALLAVYGVAPGNDPYRQFAEAITTVLARTSEKI